MSTSAINRNPYGNFFIQQIANTCLTISKKVDKFIFETNLSKLFIPSVLAMTLGIASARCHQLLLAKVLLMSGSLGIATALAILMIRATEHRN